MNEIQEQVALLLPHKRKTGPTGWQLFNCPICHLNGESSRDTRGRGQSVFNKGGFFFYCHNCHFSSGWSPGFPISKEVTMYLEALGAGHEQIQKLKLASLKIEQMDEVEKLQFYPDLKPRQLPKGAKSFNEWIQMDDPPKKFIEALKYINERNAKLLELIDFHWTDDHIGRKDGRIIIPLKYKGDILGTSMRWFDGPPNDHPKYINDIPSGFMYNADLLDEPYRKYLVLVEGALDAAAIDGIGIMKNRITEKQLQWLKGTEKRIIVLADRDQAGGSMIDQAIEQEWMVAFPPWHEEIKDAEQASRKYGRTWTVHSIINSAVDGEMMIKIKKSQWLR